MPTFSEISTQLDAALKNVAAKKDVFDKASSAVQYASNEYQDAISKAQELRSLLTTALAEVLPTNPNVRQ